MHFTDIKVAPDFVRIFEEVISSIRAAKSRISKPDMLSSITTEDFPHQVCVCDVCVAAGVDTGHDRPEFAKCACAECKNHQARYMSFVEAVHDVI